MNRFFALLTAILAIFAAAELTAPVKSQGPSEAVVITDKPVTPAGPAQCWEAPDIPEDYENDKIEAALLEKAHKIENCMVTHYAACVECCGNDLGITASGRKATPYVSVAVDPCVIPLGSDVLVDYGDGEIKYYRSDDTGSGVTGDHIDLCVGSYDEAVQLGVRTATVYWIGQEVETD